jgi:glycosyltransferase involved in cell wall biosynthesis
MKKKILLLSDDIRIPSGIGTMSKSFVMNTLKDFDWVQMAGAIKHPEAQKTIDMSDAMAKETGVEDASVILYGVDGYGDQNILRAVIAKENPDAILHFTDPRFWGWLYDMEHEIRQSIPIMYYNIWDDLPFPHWNENAYESCDLLMAISQQTYNINKHVCIRKPRIEDTDLTYVQHGIDENMFKVLPKDDPELLEFKKRILGDREYDYIALFNSRNIIRKHPADLISAFNSFVLTLPEDARGNTALVLHTDIVDGAGTDLKAVAHRLAGDSNIIFSTGKLTPPQMNYLYNLADVMCNPSSAEGFGLSHMEAMMSGTPTIASVIGGLQDQMGFTINGRPMGIEDFTEEIPSNSTGKISKEHGEWVYPLWPQVALQGSPPTPYIYDSRVSLDQITRGLKYWHDVGSKIRKERGLAGRTWAINNKFTAKGMAEAMTNSINICLDTWQSRNKFELIDVSNQPPQAPSGVLV